MGGFCLLKLNSDEGTIAVGKHQANSDIIWVVGTVELFNLRLPANFTSFNISALINTYIFIKLMVASNLKIYIIYCVNFILLGTFKTSFGPLIPYLADLEHKS